MSETNNARQGPKRYGALVGLLVAAVALGVAHLVSALSTSWRSPVVTIGESVIDRVPPWVKDFAIRTFGANDKVALQIGTLVILAVFAMVLGLVSRRHPRVAAAGVSLFGIVGAASAVTRPSATWTAALPSLVGAAAGIAALFVLRDRILVRPLAAAEPAERAAQTDPGALADTAAPATATAAGSSASTTVGGGTMILDRTPERQLERPGVFHRRQILLTTVAAVGVAALAGGAGQALRRRFSVANRRASIVLPPAASPLGAVLAADTVGEPGIQSFITPNADFYRVDTALVLPQVDPDSWRLRIHGMVDREIELSYDDLLNRRDLVERDLTMVCVSNEIGGQLAGTARWLGVPLATLLDEAGAQAGATQLVSRSVDGWNCGSPTAVVTDGRDALLVIGMNGEPLPIAHGFPARLIVPGLYGYVSATKWVKEIELTTMEAFDGYWVRRSWAKEAPIKTFSRIDTPKGLARIPAGETMIGGVAWEPHTGISGVEVKVDDGPWQPARLGEVPSVDTWAQWVLPWTATPGRHSVTVRATNADGVVQTEDRAEPIPDGASGWHSIVVIVD